MRFILPALILSLSFWSCAPKEGKEKYPSDETGGPCTFDTTIEPIVVKRIEPMSENTLHIVFKSSWGTDSFDHTLNIQEYENEFQSSATHIKVADTFQLLDLRTIGGSCAGKPVVYMKRFASTGK